MDYSTRTFWRFKTSDGEAAELQVKAAATEGPEVGLMAWVIKMGSSSYRALLPESDFNTKFVAKFILHFRHCPEWREHFRNDIPNHPQEEVVLITGNVILVDKGISRYVSALCDRDFMVNDSRQGDSTPNGRSAMIRFAGAIPEAIESATLNLGWLNLDRSIEAISPRGWAREYNQMFHLLLDDWMHGDVDPTGSRYALYREPAPFMPAWPKLPPQALLEHDRKVRKDVEKVNLLDTKATFHDLVSLLCGRDRYSRMNLEKLREQSSEDLFLDYLEELIPDPAGLARALRWRLRGLRLELVVRKSQIEAALNRRDEIRREEYRVKKSMELVIA